MTIETMRIKRKCVTIHLISHPFCATVKDLWRKWDAVVSLVVSKYMHKRDM